MTTLKDLRKKLSRPRAKPVGNISDRGMNTEPPVQLEKPIGFSKNSLGDIESDDFFYISLHSSEPGEKLENEVRFSGYIRQGVKLRKTDALGATMSAEAAFPIFESEEGIIMYAALSDKFGKLISSTRSEKKMAPSMCRVTTRMVIRMTVEDRCLR